MGISDHTTSLYNAHDLETLFNEKQFLLQKGLVGVAIEQGFDIFLSHSFYDKEIIKGLYLDLTLKGYKVYVDWVVDTDLERDNVTRDSANKIRTRMKASRSLLLAVPTNNGISKWIPWELGYVDGSTGKCAIIPIAETSDNKEQFSRAEYLKLYPYVVIRSYGSNQFLYVRDSAELDVPLETWLSMDRAD